MTDILAALALRIAKMEREIDLLTGQNQQLQAELAEAKKPRRTRVAR